MKPYVQADGNAENVYIRTFDESTQQSELVWHRDPEDRYVWCEHDTDWKLQLDDRLPVALNDSRLFVPKETYHRLIKGTGTVHVHVLKLDK